MIADWEKRRIAQVVGGVLKRLGWERGGLGGLDIRWSVGW